MTISVDQFAKFLDSYKANYLDSITEISRPRNDDGSSCRVKSNLRPLIKSDINMLDFDTMCCESSFFRRSNRPSTVDALYYRITQQGKLILYLIEFKGSHLNWDNELRFKELDIIEGLLESAIKEEFKKNNINNNLDQHYADIHKRIKDLCNYNKNKIEFSLRLKAFESIFMVLPSIYKEYWECNVNTNSYSDFITSDVLEFFESPLCEIQLLVVGKTYDENKSRQNSKFLSHKIHKQYSRLKSYAPYTVGYFKLYNPRGFYKFLEQLGEEGDIKTLND